MLICYWGLIWLLPRISKMLRGGIVFFIFFPFFFFPLLFQVKHIMKLPGHSSIKDAICKTQDMKENKNTEKKNTTKHYTQIKVFCFSAKLKTYILMHF